MSIPEGHVKEEVKSVVDGSDRLPVSVGEELTMVGQALSTFVRWPKRLVGSSPDDVYDDEDAENDPLAVLQWLLLNHQTMITNVMLEPKTRAAGHDEMILIEAEVVQELLTGNDWLGVILIQMAMEECASFATNGGGFISPVLASYFVQRHMDPKTLRQHIESRLLTDCRILLCGLNTGQHWMLLIIDKYQGRVVVLDSLPRDNQKKNPSKL